MQDLTLNIYKPRNIPVYRTFSPDACKGANTIKFLIPELQKLPEDATYFIDDETHSLVAKYNRLETPEEVQARRDKDSRSDELLIQQEKKQLIALAKKYSSMVKILEE